MTDRPDVRHHQVVEVLAKLDPVEDGVAWPDSWRIDNRPLTAQEVTIAENATPEQWADSLTLRRLARELDQSELARLRRQQYRTAELLPEPDDNDDLVM